MSTDKQVAVTTRSGKLEGDFQDGYRWRYRIEPAKSDSPLNLEGLAAFTITDGRTTTVPIGNFIEFDIQRFTHAVHGHLVIGCGRPFLGGATGIEGIFFFCHDT